MESVFQLVLWEMKAEQKITYGRKLQATVCMVNGVPLCYSGCTIYMKEQQRVFFT
jgi:hypothetical protein